MKILCIPEHTISQNIQKSRNSVNVKNYRCDYVHCYINNNYGIIAIVLITMLINPLIISALSRRSPLNHWCISACLQGQQVPIHHQE